MHSVNKTARMLVLALPVALASAAHAAGGADTSSKHAAARTGPDSAAQAAAVDFALIDKLPPRYAGSDCSAIARKLKSLDTGKSEYETTAAYNARIAALSGRKIDGARTMAEPVAFVVAGRDIASTYVADAGHLDVTAKPERVSLIVERDSRPGVIVSDRSEEERRVVMSNAFGAKVEGTAAQRTVCALAFRNISDFDQRVKGVSALVPMTPAEAKAAKQQLALMYVGTIAPPFLGTYEDYHKATLDDPHEVSWRGDSVVLNLSEIWLFNRATGTIYKKVPVSGQATGANAARPPMPATIVHGGSVEMDNCKPAYPARSKINYETGTVTLSYWISPEGRVLDSKIVRSSGFLTLDKAAQEAISKCTFHPWSENGVPVDSLVEVWYRFSLDD